MEETLRCRHYNLREFDQIGIYGTGLAGRETFMALEKMGIHISFFLDGDAGKEGSDFCGRKIQNIGQIVKEAVILIAAAPAYGIHKRLEAAGIHEWDYVDPALVRLHSEGRGMDWTKRNVEKNKDAVERVYRMLADEKSRKVFRAVLEHRMSHDLARIDAVYDREQYFGNDVIPYAVGNFVDCGAFCGDTLKRFFRQKISWGGIRGNYYAFEADESNCSDILSYCESEHMQNVSVYHLAVCDEKKTVSFKQDGSDIKVTGTICEKQDENSILVPGDSLDSVLGGTKVDMITMDIEGAEIQALYGAQECIQTHHPKLAVSAYHELEHLWEIPLLIHRMVPDYRIFYRHHCWNMYDTVCYAV